MHKDLATLSGPDVSDLVDANLDAAMRAVRIDHSVALLATNPLSPFEFSIACEIFGLRRADVFARMADPSWYELRICASNPGSIVETGLDVDMVVRRGLDDLVTADTVIVPTAPRAPGSETHRAGLRAPMTTQPDVVEAVREARRRGARIVSFCSGAFTLAEAGVLDGHRATTHWMYLESFRRQFPRVQVVPDVLYVDDGPVLTSAGSAAAMDLALHILRDDHGADVADLVARRMVIPPHREGGQAQYIVVPEPRDGGAAFASLLDWMTENVHRPLEISDLARRAAMSERTFSRRFRDATGTTPHQWLTARRVTRARQLLETTDLTIDAVASRSGLGSSANLRLKFKEACAVSPSDYRRRFRRR